MSAAEGALPYRARPCAECPWRLDTPPGQFDVSRFVALRKTSLSAEGHPGLGDPMFACHKTAEGREQACAGWLAVCGRNHVGVRLALAYRRLPLEAVKPGPDWPELFASYDEMAAAQARAEDDEPHDD